MSITQPLHITPLEYYRDGHSRVPLEPVDDVGGLVAIYPLDGLAVDDLGAAAHGVVQPELDLFLGRHARQPPLYGLQSSYGGQVGLQHHVQLQGEEQYGKCQYIRILWFVLLEYNYHERGGKSHLEALVLTSVNMLLILGLLGADKGGIL